MSDIFDKVNCECYELYEISTDENGKRSFTMGTYIYCAGSSVLSVDEDPDEKYIWRCI